jgi:hypothetical protein
LHRFLDTYFRTADPPPLADVRSSLWKGRGEPGDPAANVSFSAVLLEQYKIYVEMADRVSARRGLANTFFLTLNTAAITAIGVVWSGKEHGIAWVLPLLFVALMIECLAWFWLLRSYRQLNAAKYLVVGALEEQLPASPYWSAEWSALGEGRDPARYWPLSHLEQWIPMLFIGVYLFGLIAALITRL